MTGKKIHPFVGPPDPQNEQTSFNKHRDHDDFSEEPRIVDRKAGRPVHGVFDPGTKSRKKPRRWKIEQTEERVKEDEERGETMAEKRGSSHQRKEEKRPAFAPGAGQRELEPKVSYVPEGVDSREGVGGFRSRHCERDGKGRRAPGVRPALVFRIHSEKALRHSAARPSSFSSACLATKIVPRLFRLRQAPSIVQQRRRATAPHRTRVALRA